MRLTEARASVGNRAAFSGNADANAMSLGTVGQVRAEARRLMAEGGRGYLLPCYFTQNAPLVNALAWADEVTGRPRR